MYTIYHTRKKIYKSNMGIFQLLDFCCQQPKLLHRFPSEFPNKNNINIIQNLPFIFANKKITGYKFWAL